MDLTTTETIIVSLALAVIGYIFTHYHSLSLEKARNRLDWVNRQLNEFYGPLLAIVEANQKAWESFISRYDYNPDFYKKAQNPNRKQVAEFHHWMKTVFMPNNEMLHEIIINKTSLMKEHEIPEELLELMAHIAEFRIIMDLRKDEYEDVADTTSKYPAGKLRLYCKDAFMKLKAEQAKLLKLVKN